MNIAVMEGAFSTDDADDADEDKRSGLFMHLLMSGMVFGSVYAAIV